MGKLILAASFVFLAFVVLAWLQPANGKHVVSAKDQQPGSDNTYSIGSPPAIEYPSQDTTIADSTEVSPEPEKGMQAFMQWVGRNYRFPKEAVKANVSGTIWVNFVVEVDGSLGDIEVVEDLGYGTKEAAIKLLKEAPKWKPGMLNGEPVRVLFSMPIRLNL